MQFLCNSCMPCCSLAWKHVLLTIFSAQTMSDKNGMALQVCVVDLAESDWQMLPRQARSISSDQVQMQRQQSLVRSCPSC